MSWIFMIFAMIYTVRMLFCMICYMSESSTYKTLTIWQKGEKEKSMQALKVFGAEVVLCLCVAWLLFYGYVISSAQDKGF